MSLQLEPCKICSQPAHGRNFGVISCRACAAFFRRAAPQNIRNVAPSENDEDCIIFQDGRCDGERSKKMEKFFRYTCKKCRLKKCYQVGMDPKKFQLNRDPLSTSNLYMKQALKIPKSLSNFLGRPEFILCLEPDKSSPVKTIIDVSYLIRKAENIFQQESESIVPRRFENNLEQITYSMESEKLKVLKHEPVVVSYIGKSEYLMFWELTFVSAAKWLAEIPEFSKLGITLKLRILQTAWMLWARLKKLAETAERQRSQKLKDDVYMWTEDTCMDMKNVQVDLGWCTNYTTEQMSFYLTPDSDQNWKQTIDLLISLQPTNVELNFMLIHFCLHEAGTRCQGAVLEATDRIIQAHTDNLHDYYTRNLKMSHYSVRLQKLLKINHLVESSVRLRRERNRIAEVFDVFSVQFSHPEMFELT